MSHVCTQRTLFAFRLLSISFHFASSLRTSHSNLARATKTVWTKTNRCYLSVALVFCTENYYVMTDECETLRAVSPQFSIKLNRLDRSRWQSPMATWVATGLQIRVSAHQLMFTARTHRSISKTRHIQLNRNQRNHLLCWATFLANSQSTVSAFGRVSYWKLKMHSSKTNNYCPITDRVFIFVAPWLQFTPFGKNRNAIADNNNNGVTRHRTEYNIIGIA